MMQPKKPQIAFLSHLDINLYRFRLPLMIKMINNGWQVYAIVPKGKYIQKFVNYGITPIFYRISRKSMNPFLELNTINELYQILKCLKPNILHTFTAKPNIYGTIAGRLAHIPVIVNSVTGLGSFYIDISLKARGIKFILNLFYTLNLCLSNCTIFQNFDDFKYFRRKNICKNKHLIVVKSSGVNTSEFSPQSVNFELKKRLRKDLNLNRKIIVLMVARLLKHKGIMEYCQAARIIKKKTNYKNAIEFVLAGDFDKGNPFSIDENNLNYFTNNQYIRYLGWRDDIKNLIALCDIFVLPSYREGIPRTLIEAASMGKPLIAADSVGCREVVEHQKNGYLVPRENYTALVKAIDHLLKEKDLQKKFGQYSRSKAIKEFDEKIVLDKTLSLYDTLINKDS